FLGGHSLLFADETLYMTQAVEGVEYVFKTSPFGATIVRLHKRAENVSDQLVFPNRLGGRKVTALEGCLLPGEHREVSIGGMMRGDRRSLVNDKTAIGFKHIVLQDSIKAIGDEAFHHCEDIVSIDLPDSVLDIGYQAFRGCSSLIEVKMPRHIEVIKNSTFENCSSLRKILLPDALQAIETGAFDGCYHLTAPPIAKDVKGSRYAFSAGFACENNGVAYKIEERGDAEVIIEKAFIFEPIKALTIPEALKGRRVVKIRVVECASNEFENISSVVLPSSINEIDSSFFRNFTNVEAISMPGVSKVWRCFDGLKKLKTVDIPNVQIIGYHAFTDCVSLKTFDMPDTLKEIGEMAFAGCSGLTEIHLPDSFKELGREAFKDCISLETITFPVGCTEVNRTAFSNCINLKVVALPGVKEIDGVFLEDSKKLVSVDISGVVRLGGGAFADCGCLKSIALPETLKDIGYGAFKNCKSLRSVEIPENVRELPESSFEGCIALEEVRFPKSLGRIRYDAFRGCMSLRSIELPSALTSIESRAFEGCKMLESLTIPDGVNEVDDNAFKDCVNLGAEAKARLRKIGYDMPEAPLQMGTEKAEKEREEARRHRDKEL
ncbi:MAG: leucine-rich repeat domain-containing protein, partial [Kiritimatiellae bacterium]|nr:leucine-rich repeat domain-containing protein [Kiritimatiellia bacterium]